MLTLAQARRARGMAGVELGLGIPRLAEAGIKVHRGQLVLVAAGPGCGKSVLALNMILKADPMVRTLYFSADSDAFTQTTRALSIMTGQTLDESAEDVLYGKDTPEPFHVAPVRFSFNTGPTVADIRLQLEAWHEVYGGYPELVVIDNVTDIVPDDDDGDPFSGVESILGYLDELAKLTGSTVLALHHVTGPYNDSDKPVPLSGLKGQVGRKPQLVLTMYKETSSYGDTTLFVSAVKNREGQADSSGRTAVSLRFDGPRAFIG